MWLQRKWHAFLALLFYLSDVILQAYNGFKLFMECRYDWAFLTLALLGLPGAVFSWQASQDIITEALVAAWLGIISPLFFIPFTVWILARDLLRTTEETRRQSYLIVHKT